MKSKTQRQSFETLSKGAPPPRSKAGLQAAASGGPAASEHGGKAKFSGKLRLKPGRPSRNDGVGTDSDPFRRRLRAYVLQEAHALFGQGKKPATADPETIHQMRIASRRLEASLKLFFGQVLDEEGCGILTELRAIRRCLGEVRTIDVNLSLLNERAQRWGNEVGKAAAWARNQLLADRQRVQTDLERVIDASAFESLGKRVEAIARRSPARDAGLVHHAIDELHQREKKFRRRQARVLSENRSACFHKFRIAAKQYRYLLELCASIFDMQVQRMVRELIAIQDLTGRVHDSELLVQHLDVAREKNPPADGEAWRESAELIRRLRRLTSKRFKEFKNHLVEHEMWKTSFAAGPGLVLRNHRHGRS